MNADRDALVERMAKAMSLDQRQRHGISDCAWADDIEMWRTECRARARAALAVAEPAIRADEREAVAVDLSNMGRGHVAHEHALILRVVDRVRARKEPRP
jgi:hypothetical protein